jgi:AMP deaminase
MMRSLQRLGDDPRDHDDYFQPFVEEYADVSSVRPDTPLPAISVSEENGSSFIPWKIYPEPPPPHWHWKDKTFINPDGTTKAGEEFEFEKCVIPGPHEGWSFAVDEKGVYQVYDRNKGRYCICLLELIS